MTKRLPSCLTPQEVFALTSWEPADPLSLRNLCMIRLMTNAGLRSKEVLGLKVEDLDLDTGRLLVAQGKGGRQRSVWIGEDDLALVRRWLLARQEIAKPGCDHLFVARHGWGMQPRNLRKMVKAVALMVGIVRDVHPHMLRHTFATDLLRATKNLRLTQKALGHAHIATTTIYTHIVDEELEEAMKGLRAGGAGASKTPALPKAKTSRRKRHKSPSLQD